MAGREGRRVGLGTCNGNRSVRVLCVCPRFAPLNAADGHRVRLLLPHLAANGCQAEVLAVSPEPALGPSDPWLTLRLPSDTPIHRVRPWPLRGWGLRGLAQRCIVPLYRRGSELLASLRERIGAWELPQEAAAKRLGITRPRLNDLMRGKLGKFSLDALVNLSSAAGLELEIKVQNAA